MCVWCGVVRCDANGVWCVLCCAACCVLCAVCCVLCAVCCVLCAVCCVLCVVVWCGLLWSVQIMFCKHFITSTRYFPQFKTTFSKALHHIDVLATAMQKKFNAIDKQHSKKSSSSSFQHCV